MTPIPDTRQAASDAEAAKAATRAEWDAAAAGWSENDPLLQRWLGAATDAMLGMAGVGPGAHVLDVAAGAGGQTLAAAARVGALGSVLATDLSPAILDRAGARAEAAGWANVRTQVGDGEALPVPSAAFDAVVCRLGLMLFPDPLRGLREMHRALRRGGGVCTVVFSSAERNPCLSILAATARKHAGSSPGDSATPGGLLSLGGAGRIDALFRAAGFADVATTTMAAPFRLDSLERYLAFVRSSAGPIHGALAPLDPDAREAAWAEMAERLAAFSTPAGWEGPHELLLTAGRRR